MKKNCSAVLFFSLISSLALQGRGNVVVRPGLWYGPQTINDAKIKSTYGGQSVFQPYLEIQFWKGLTVGVGYEFGYDGDGIIGLFQYPTSFRMSGLNIYLGYELRAKKISFSAKAGYGLYAYRQTIVNPAVVDYTVDDRKSTFLLSGGFKYYPSRFLFLAVEVRYVPLKVKPYEYEVDLGGIRYMAGIGFSLDL